MAVSPSSDTNCNLYIPPSAISGSMASTLQDFSQDYSDYQWFPDFGCYRDGTTHHSILSALSASYNGIGELSYYEDLAKNIDANLAEADMESFRTEDIHSLLANVPTALCDSSTDGSNQNNNCLDNSLYKSKLLFSPVKESNISVDSLDLDGYPAEEDIILTCKANKNNYTIAFEQSVLYSDESYYGDGPVRRFGGKLLSPTAQPAMSQSAVGYTTWSKVKRNGNAFDKFFHAQSCYALKSLSMPNLKVGEEGGGGGVYDAEDGGGRQTVSPPNINQLNVSHANATDDTMFTRPRHTLPMPMYTQAEPADLPLAPADSSIENNEETLTHHNHHQLHPQQPTFNLVKLFIKQKSNSTDTGMDVSSGCWPSDSTNSGGSGDRKKSMHDSGKCSTLVRHDEEEFQLDSLDAQINNQNNNNNLNNNNNTEDDRDSTTSTKTLNDFNKPLNDSPKRCYKSCNLNIRKRSDGSINGNNNSNNNGSYGKESPPSDVSRTSENLTQIFSVKRKTKKTVPIEMITKSMQTSYVGGAKETVRLISPSFLEHLKKVGEARKAPVFVVYPDYALPDLTFLTQTQREAQDVVISPLSYKENVLRKPRPMSMGDMESMKGRNNYSNGSNKYKHVRDWRSLMQLLPDDYRKMLQNIPEVKELTLTAEDSTLQQPLFCMTPPLLRRGACCDCASVVTNTQTTFTSTSSGGSSSQAPPSSGYRGSSTMLTDSEFGSDGSCNLLNNNHFMYQYDSPAAEVHLPHEKPPAAGRSMPKGILRHPNVQRRPMKAKRNSMFEEQSFQLQQRHQQQHHTATEQKRRSLQEHQHHPQQHYHHHQQQLLESDLERRQRAEQFLSHVPPSELKHYAEIAHTLEYGELTEPCEPYDRTKELRNEVSRALSQKRNVPAVTVVYQQHHQHHHQQQQLQQQQSPVVRKEKPQLLLRPPTERAEFSTPPNSPNMSVASSIKRPPVVPAKAFDAADAERQKQEKIQSNRFKRLQIQWELLSKEGTSSGSTGGGQSSTPAPRDSKPLEVKSGGSTPTGPAPTPKSRIPRPVSYPTTRIASDPVVSKTLKAATTPPVYSRIVPPKRYGVAIPSQPITKAPIPTVVPPTPTPIPRTPNKTPYSNGATGGGGVGLAAKKTPIPARRTATRTR